MGLVHNGVPHDLAFQLKQIGKIDCFFETGTFHGQTSLWASQNFERVITVEASTALYAVARKNLEGCRNVEAVFGKSAGAIAKRIFDLPNTIFWLDAHWSAGDTAGQDAECPLLSELAIIAPTLNKNIVMIDDARFFTEAPPRGHNYLHWPTLDEIFRVLSSVCNVYTIIKDDVIVSVPVAYRSLLVAALRSS